MSDPDLLTGWWKSLGWDQQCLAAKMCNLSLTLRAYLPVNVKVHVIFFSWLEELSAWYSAVCVTINSLGRYYKEEQPAHSTAISNEKYLFSCLKYITGVKLQATPSGLCLLCQKVKHVTTFASEFIQLPYWHLLSTPISNFLTHFTWEGSYMMKLPIPSKSNLL